MPGKMEVKGITGAEASNLWKIEADRQREHLRTQEAVKAFKNYEKTVKDADRQFGDLAKVASPTTKAMMDFIKVINNVKQQFSKLSYEIQTNNKAKGFGQLVNSPEFRQQYVRLANRAGQFRAQMDEQRTQERRDRYAAMREKERDRMERVSDRWRQGVDKMYAGWRKEDAAEKTKLLVDAVGTITLSKPPAGMVKKLGKVTQEFLDTAITESLTAGKGARGVATMRMTPRDYNFLQRPFAKETTALATDAARKTVRDLSFGRKTTPFFEDPYKYRQKGGPSAGELPPLPPLPPDVRSEPPLPSHAAVTIGKTIAAAYALYKVGRIIGHVIKVGGNSELDNVRAAMQLTTNYPTMELAGAGMRGLKGPMGAGRDAMDTFGPTTVREVMALSGLYGAGGPNPGNTARGIQRALQNAGVPVNQWNKVISSYGVRGTGAMDIATAITQASMASLDPDLGYKSMPGWVAYQGRLTQMGYGKQVPAFMQAFRGAQQAGGMNNINKQVLEDAFTDALETVQSRGNVGGLSNLSDFIGGIMGSTAIPSLRSGTGLVQGLAAVQGAEMGTVQNPYLYNILGTLYKGAASKSKLKFGDPGIWKEMFPDIDTTDPTFGKFLGGMKGAPLAYQIGMLSQQGALPPNELLDFLDKYFQGRKGGKNAINMTQELGVLAAGGADTGALAPLIRERWFGRGAASTTPVGGMGGDLSVTKPGDTTNLLRMKAAEGTGEVLAGDVAVTFSGAAANFADSVDKFREVTEKWLGTTTAGAALGGGSYPGAPGLISGPTGGPVPAHGGSRPRSP